MKISIYSTFWSIQSKSFDYRGALSNWAVYADQISIAIPSWDTESEAPISAYAKERGFPVSIVRTDFHPDHDDLFYGKTENAALQNCDGSLLIQQNGDERFRAAKNRLEELHEILQNRWDIQAFWVPTIDLYGSVEKYLPPARAKWYIHSRGIFRGAAPGTIKPDGHPDYNKTSGDEALDVMGNLVPTASIYSDLSIESIRTGVAAGWPISYHLGYVSFGERVERSRWWKAAWEKATGGDQNKHPVSIEEMAVKSSIEHGLPMWATR